MLARVDEPIDRLLRACGLRSFAYLRYPPVRIVAAAPAPLPDSPEVEEPPPRAPDPPAAPAPPAAPVARVAFPVSTRPRRPSRPGEAVPAAAPSTRLRAVPPAPSATPRPAFPIAAPAAGPPLPVPPRRFALLEEVSAQLAGQPPSWTPREVAPPPPAAPRLRVRRRHVPRSDLSDGA